MIRALAPYAATVIQVVLMSLGLAGAANGQVPSASLSNSAAIASIIPIP